MAKKFDEVDEIILNDLDNLVTFESFYSEDGMFLEDIYKKFQKDKKILDDISEKYSKKHGPTSSIMKENRMVNLKEIITKLNWADRCHKVVSDNNPNLDEYKELQSEYVKLEKKHSKNKKGNNNNNNSKEKKEKASTKKKAKEEIYQGKDNNIAEEKNAAEDFKKEDLNNSHLFKNEFDLLNTFIEQIEQWSNLFKGRLNILSTKIQEIQAQEISFAKDNKIDIGKASEAKDLQSNNKANVSNNSTVKNSKKKRGKKKTKAEEQLNEENNINEMEIEAIEISNLQIEAEIPLEEFAEKFTEDEFKQMLEFYKKLKIKSNEENEFIEKQKNEYIEWEKRFNKVKSMDRKTAQMLLLKAKKLILFSPNMKNLLNIFNACLGWSKDANLIIDNYKNILDEFYFDSLSNKVKITNDKLISEFTYNDDKNPQAEEKTNLVFNSIIDLMSQIKTLKEEYENNPLNKDSNKNDFDSLELVEDKLKNASFIANKVLCEENNLDFLKYFSFKLHKTHSVFQDVIDKINKKIDLLENFNNFINGEQVLNSFESLKQLEAKLAEFHINSDEIKIKINEKKNILLESQNNLDNLKKKYLENGKVPDKKSLFDLHNKIRLNKLFIETKYSLLINSWNKYYDWYENIIKLLITLNTENKKNKNNVCFNSEKNGDEEKTNKATDIQQSQAAEIKNEFEGGITEFSEKLENDIDLISKLDNEQLKLLLGKIQFEFNENSYDKVNLDDENNNKNNKNNFENKLDEVLSLKGNFLNLKKNLESAIIYKKISQITSIYNIYGVKDSINNNNNNEKPSIDNSKMEIDDSVSSDKEQQLAESRFSLKDVFDIYNSNEYEICYAKDNLRDRINTFKILVSDIKKWFREFLELYHIHYSKNNLENFFLSKNLITKLLPSRSQSLLPKNIASLGNINSEYSKIDFEQIKEMKFFFELIRLISILTDYSKSTADLINFEKKINNGNKRKYSLVHADYANLKNDFVKKIEKLNFDYMANALESEFYVVGNIFINEAIKLLNNTNESEYEVFELKEKDNFSISLFKKIQKEKNLSSNANALKKDLESILDKTHFNKEIEKEIVFYQKWIEKFNNYVSKKQSKNYEQIDLCLVEILITESHKSLFDLSAEMDMLKRDIEGNKNANEALQKLITESENFSIKLSEANEKTLEDLIANQKNFSDINAINRIKSLYWTQRAINFISNSKAKKLADSSKEKDALASKSNNNNKNLNNYSLNQMNIESLNYKSALKFSQEASSLINFQEIKRKEYYFSLINQITAARNIRDVIELIKSSNSTSLKQPISEDSFEKIQTEIELCLIDLPEEIELIEKFKDEKQKFLEKFNKFLEENHTISEYEKFVVVLKSFGILMPKLISKLERNVSDSFAINKEIKRLFDLHKINKITLFKETVNNILAKYKSLKIETEFGKGLESMMDSSENKLAKLKEMILNNENFDLNLNLELSDDYLKNEFDAFNEKDVLNTEIDIFDVTSILNSIEIHDTNEEKKIKKKLWLKKYELIFEKEKYTPDFHFLKTMYAEINEISIAELNSYDKVDNLMSTLKKSQDLINKILNSANKDALQILKDDTKELKIDLNEYFIQQEVKLECKGLNTKLETVANKGKNANKLSEFKHILFENFNKNFSKTIENTESKKLGFEQNPKKPEAAAMSGFIEIENNAKADKIVLNKSILNLKGNNNNNIPNLDFSSVIEKLNSENKLLGNKRRQDEIVDLITNSNNNEDFLQTNENQILSNTRSRRNINMKIDKDFYYDKEFIKNFESIKGKNSSNKNLTEANKNLSSATEKEQQEISNQPATINLLDDELDKSDIDQNKSSFLDKKNSETNLLLNDSFVISGEVSEEENEFAEEIKSEKNDKNTVNNLKEKSAYDYIYDSDKTEKRKNDVENIKRMINQGLKTPSLLRTGFNRVLDPLKESIRKNSLLQIQLALKENLTFYNKLGEEKIDKMADELENHVKLNNPLVNENYSKAVDTMIKVLKELRKYENVSMLIVREKLNLNKVAFYPYGPKLIEKLKKINESASPGNKKADVVNNKNNNINNVNQANIKSINNDNSHLKALLINQKNLKTSIKKNQNDKDPKKSKNDNLDFLSMMNEMNEFYNSLSASDALKSKLETAEDKSNDKNNKESQITESLIRCNSSTSVLDNSLSIPHDDLHLDEDDDSLKSEYEMDIIKFSPTNKNEEKSNLQGENQTNENNLFNKPLTENSDSHLDISMNTEENTQQNFKKTTNYFKNISNSQARNANNALNSTENNSNKYVSPFEKLYNPFEIEEDEEEQRVNLDPKGKKRNVCLPFFYNPDFIKLNSNAEEDKNLNVELNFDANYINGFLNNFEKSKKISQIWTGNIQTSKLDFPVKFLTTYPSEVFSKLLSLPDNLLLASKTTTKEVVNYLEKNITKDEKLFLFSWVEIEDEKDIENYRKLADEYDKSDKTALIKNGEDKYYVFPMSNRYSRLIRKITPCFEFINKDLMNKLDKIFAVAIVIKNPLIACSGNKLNPILLEERILNVENPNNSKSDIQHPVNLYPFNNYDQQQQQNSYNYPMNINQDNNQMVLNSQSASNQDYYQIGNNNYADYTQDSNFIQEENNSNYYQGQTENSEKPTLSSDDNVQMNLENEAEQEDKMSSITDENEEANYAEDKKDFANKETSEPNNPHISEEANLELYLRNDDLTMLEDYVNRHFSNLSQEEMVNKLMSLDENFREKLLNLVMEYQQRLSNDDASKIINNQNEAANIINTEESNSKHTESQEVMPIMHQPVLDSNNYETINNEIPQQQNEMMNQNPQEIMQNNIDCSNNLPNINNAGFIQNNNTSNIPNAINNMQNINDNNNMLNSGIQNQQMQKEQFYPNQNPLYYQQQQQQNQIYNNNMPNNNYQNMNYNQNNYNQNPRMMNNMTPPINNPHGAQNNFMNNNPNYQMNNNNYQMQMRNQTPNPMMNNNNMQHGGNRRGNYNNNYGGNPNNRNYGGYNHHRNNQGNQGFRYNNQNANVVNTNYQNRNYNSNFKDDQNSNNANNNN